MGDNGCNAITEKLQKLHVSEEDSPAPETLTNSTVEISRLTSFLDFDDSFFSPWNWNPNSTKDGPSNTTGEKQRMIFETGSFFSYEPTNIVKRTVAQRKKILVGWQKPPLDWVKVNTDGVVKENGMFVGIGGLIRNSNGDWIAGFVRNLGSCNELKAKLWAILDGLHVAWDSKFYKVQIETDSETVVQLIMHEDKIQVNHEYSNLIIGIRNMLEKDWNVVMRHVYQEENQCANLMANISLCMPLGKYIMLHAPDSVRAKLIEDIRGVMLPRVFIR